jgi:hypothetical protein
MPTPPRQRLFADASAALLSVLDSGKFRFDTGAMICSSEMLSSLDPVELHPANIFFFAGAGAGEDAATLLATTLVQHGVRDSTDREVLTAALRGDGPTAVTGDSEFVDAAIAGARAAGMDVNVARAAGLATLRIVELIELSRAALSPGPLPEDAWNRATSLLSTEACSMLATTEASEDWDSVHGLLFDGGVVEAIALDIEAERQRLHGLLDPQLPHHHRWLLAVDQHASLLYSVPAPVLKPERGPWTRAVLDAVALVGKRLAHWGPPAYPALVPWPQQAWMYVPNRHIILFPDLDRDSDEILAQMALVLGESDPERIREHLEAHVFLVVAHEFFHFWRDAAGRLTNSLWREEWVANRMAASLVAAEDPALVQRAASTLREVLYRLDPDGDAPRMRDALLPEDLLLEGANRSAIPELPQSKEAWLLAQLSLSLDLLERDGDLPTEVDAHLLKPKTEPELQEAPPRLAEADVDLSLVPMFMGAAQWAVREPTTDPALHAGLEIALAQGEQNMLPLWSGLTMELGLDLEQACVRASCNYLLFCSSNLLDDLLDGDCNYLSREEALLVFFGLQNLSWHMLCRAGIPGDAALQRVRLIGDGLAAGMAEVRGEIRDADSFLALGEGLAGAQFAAYLALFLHGTEHQAAADRWGRALGHASHLVQDILTNDKRFWARSESERDRIVATVAERARAVVREPELPESLRNLLELTLGHVSEFERTARSGRAE